jgi:hypothetical protein
MVSTFEMQLVMACLKKRGYQCQLYTNVEPPGGALFMGSTSRHNVADAPHRVGRNRRVVDGLISASDARENR